VNDRNFLGGRVVVDYDRLVDRSVVSAEAGSIDERGSVVLDRAATFVYVPEDMQRRADTLQASSQRFAADVVLRRRREVEQTPRRRMRDENVGVIRNGFPLLLQLEAETLQIERPHLVVGLPGRTVELDTIYGDTAVLEVG